MSTANEVFVFDAVRSPRGRAREGGGLAKIAPVETVKQLADALVDRNGPDARKIDHFMLGCVGQVGVQGGHIALVAKLHAGLPREAPAWSLNNFCVSGLTAVGAATDRIIAGGAELVLAGGVESMSQVPFLADQASYYMDPAFSAALHYIPVALSADVLATQEKIGREQLDEMTVQSHLNAAAAIRDNRAQQSLIPIKAADGSVALAHDEYVRADTTTQKLGRFPAAFGELDPQYAPVVRAALGMERIDHVHAVVHAPGVADGAGLALLGTAAAGKARGLKARAQVIATAEAAGDPVLGLTAGRTAMERVLAKAGLTLNDIDLIEYMEAFAVVPALFVRDYPQARAKMNAHGGHVARGHALGATGAILLSTLIDGLEQKDLRTGMVVAFAASGIGAAMIVRRV